MALHTLPYDLLLNIAEHLDLYDVLSLHLSCKALQDFSITRPVYRQLANNLLLRCRALPLNGFQRLTDLSTDELIRSVNKATHFERAWRVRAPRPLSIAPNADLTSQSHYMDVLDPVTGDLARDSWYKVISSPPDEDVDWLSPITCKYTLCATKSGKVVCWDVLTDKCLAEWSPGPKWELWKCRVEFEERTVFFTMAKVAAGSVSDDSRVMDFVLMKLYFPETCSFDNPPVFTRATNFKTTGVVMNIFLLQPFARLLSAFIWVSGPNTIGLYVLLDWDKPEYVFIDTGIECVMSSNWSCILYKENIVIHCEESDAAFQHFYPLTLLAAYSRKLPSEEAAPTISARVPPFETLTKKFTFPAIPISDYDEILSSTVSNPSTYMPSNNPGPVQLALDTESETNSNSTPPPQTENRNPFPFPPWYPESAHFVRQWWPTLPGIPRVSCTVVLLASHDTTTHKTKFVLAQHYFSVPMGGSSWVKFDTASSDGEDDVEEEGVEDGQAVADLDAVGSDPVPAGYVHRQERSRPPSEDVPYPIMDAVNGSGVSQMRDDVPEEDAFMKMWYVSMPFEVVCVQDVADEDDDSDRPRPLVAVDFGHAVWIEYCDADEGGGGGGATNGDHTHVDESDPKWLRFVSFPPFDADRDGEPWSGTGHVRTLDIPEELDLDSVETINIDQSQGAVILSVKEGKIFILCYE